MEEWELTWLEGKPMPPHAFPAHLMGPAEDIAENWLLEDTSPRLQVEEWVSRNQAYTVMDGLLWSGFQLKGQTFKRVPPLPVWVRLLYQSEPPQTVEELKQVMIELFARVFAEWRRQFEQHGDHLETAR